MGSKTSGRYKILTEPGYLEDLKKGLARSITRNQISKHLNVNVQTVIDFVKDLGITWVLDDPVVSKGIGHYELADGRRVNEETISEVVMPAMRVKSVGFDEPFNANAPQPDVDQGDSFTSSIQDGILNEGPDRTEDTAMAGDVTDRPEDLKLKLLEQRIANEMGTLKRDQDDALKTLQGNLPTREYVQGIEQSVQGMTSQFEAFQEKMEAMFQAALSDSENGSKKTSQEMKQQFDQIQSTLGNVPSKQELVQTREEMVAQMTEALKGVPRSPEELQEAIVGCIHGKCDTVLGMLDERRQQLAQEQMKAQAEAKAQEEPEEQAHTTATDYFNCENCGPLFREAAQKHEGIRSAILESLSEKDLQKLKENLENSGYRIYITPPTQEAKVW